MRNDDNKGDSFESWLASDHEVHNISQGYEVIASIVSLPEFILRVTNLDDEIVLDIDAEGSEYPMLEALLQNDGALKRISRIIVEFHHIKNHKRFMEKEKILEMLKQHNIKLETRGFA